MLKFKLIKWFVGLVLVFGAMSTLLGIRMIEQRVVQEAQTRVRYDLSSAWSVYQSQLRSMETIVRLTAVRGPLVEACNGQKWQDSAAWEEVRGLLGKVKLDFNLDFLAVVTPEGQVVVRACPPYRQGDYRSSQPIVAQALSGTAASGTVVVSREELAQEADGLVDRAFLTLQETPHAPPTPKASEDRGMVMLAAAPIEKNGKVIGAIYAGTLLNRNQAFVDRIQSIVFGSEAYQGAPTGTVTVFLADTRVATTVRLANGNRAIGTRVSQQVADRVLDNGGSWVDRAFVVQDWYLTAYDPIRDPRGSVIGMLYVGTLERPFRDLSRGMIMHYSVLVGIALLPALILAMFIAGRIARPLHRLAQEAKKMQSGQPHESVEAEHTCDETASLILAFNEMADTLARREEQLKEANDRLSQANESLKAVNAHYMETLQFVSHELNSPLSSIMSYTYTLRQRRLGDLTDKQQSALDAISGSSRRILEMIRHYLNLARIESGEMHPMPTRVQLREDVISPLLASLGSDLKARDLHVEDFVSPDVVLHTDLNMTREVFENLLSNAIKYGRPGGRITLSCQANGPWAQCRVRNEGEGIPNDKLGELFQKFSRVELGDSRGAARGTGLGLFICRKIIESHGGTIRVESEVGQWTEFQCMFPLVDGSAAARPSGRVEEESNRVG
ncbi:MAG: cache domain-containing protein [Phycisphaerae bacterium]|jgi:two-component system NtrC family sensor kinase